MDNLIISAKKLMSISAITTSHSTALGNQTKLINIQNDPQ